VEVGLEGHGGRHAYVFEDGAVVVEVDLAVD